MKKSSTQHPWIKRWSACILWAEVIPHLNGVNIISLIMNEGRKITCKALGTELGVWHTLSLNCPQGEAWTRDPLLRGKETEAQGGDTRDEMFSKRQILDPCPGLSPPRLMLFPLYHNVLPLHAFWTPFVVIFSCLDGLHTWKSASRSYIFSSPRKC